MYTLAVEFLADLRVLVGDARLEAQERYHQTGNEEGALLLRRAKRVLYAPYPKQVLFHKSQSQAFETLYGGAAGGGKSYCMLFDAYMNCLRHPGTHNILFRRTFPQLEKSLIFLSRTMFDTSMGRYNQKERVWRIFTSGAPSFIHFGHCKNQGDVYNYHSTQFDSMYFDELTHFCYSPDTEILTENGWKNVPDVAVGEKVATLNKQNRVEYQPVVRRFVSPSSGYMNTYSSRNGVSFCVSANHKMVHVPQSERCSLKWKLSKIEDVPEFMYIPRTAKFSGRRKSLFRLPFFPGSNSVLSIRMDAWLDFLGWYLSEGCAFTRGTSYDVCIRQTKDPSKLISCLNRLGFRWCTYGDGQYHIFSKQLYEYCKQFGRSHEKFIPREFLSLSVPQLTILFDALVAGDGHRYKNGAIEYCSNSSRLANDFSELAFKIGRIATIHSHLPKRGRRVYIVSISCPKRKLSEVRKSSIKKIPYDGLVYGLQVDPFNNLYVRHNGKAMWCGNTEFQYAYLLTRLRPNVAGAKPYVKAAANPGGIGHAWVRRRWRLWDKSIQYQIYRPDRDTDDQVAIPSRCFIPAIVTENKWIMKNDPDYVNRLKASPFRKQLFDGDWSIFSGQAFPEIASGKHFAASFPIPSDWPRWVSIDYGYSRPFSAHWHAQEPGTGRIYTYRELYGIGIKETDQARRIVSMSIVDGRSERISFHVADPSVFSPRGGGSSIAQVWQDNGLIVVRGNNNRKSGKARVHSYLAMASDGRPHWIIFKDKCPNLARTLPDLVLDESDPEDVETTQEDHAYDDCRYFLMSIQPPPVSGVTEEPRRIDAASKSEWDWYQKSFLRKSNELNPLSEMNDVR